MSTAAPSVRGEAGIGKSALLAAARERALDRGVTVVSAAGALSEAQLAFAGLHQLLLPLLGRLDLLPHPQRQALETAFAIAEGDAPSSASPRSGSSMTERDIDRLVQDASIIRNRGKIQATFDNARAIMSASPNLVALQSPTRSIVRRQPGLLQT